MIYKPDSTPADIALKAYKDAMSDTSSSQVIKDATGAASFAVASGLQAYSLKAPSIITATMDAQLHQLIPTQQMNPVSDVARHKTITAVDSSSVVLSVAEDVAGNTWDHTTVSTNLTIKYQALGYKVGDTAARLGKSFEDIKATAAMINMQKFMMKEEDLMFWGNITDLGNPASVAGTASASGGTLATDTYTYKVSALTMTGYRYAQAQSSYDPTATAALVGQSGVGTSAGVSVTGATGSCVVAWTNITGAVAYNVWVDKGGGGYKFLSTVTTNKYTHTTYTATTSQTPPTTDDTGQATEYDGIWKLASASSLTTVKDMANATFTTDAGGGLTEVNSELLTYANAVGTSPDYLIGNYETIDLMSRKMTSSTAPVYRIDATADQTRVMGGIKVDSYLNRATGDVIPMIGSRRFPKNRLLGLKLKNPYSYDRINGPAFELCVAVDYFGLDYAITPTSGTVQQSEIRRYSAMRAFFPACILWSGITLT